MGVYEVQEYAKGGWVIVCMRTGKQIVIFEKKRKADDACSFLNAVEK